MKKKKNRFLRYLERWMRFGTIQPVSRRFGADRGKPVDRYYIETFLHENRDLIRGTVLEVGGSLYTRQFGDHRVTKAMTLHTANKNADIPGNLETGEGIWENVADCFILTQTLLCIFDVREAVKNCFKLLKPGGHLLVTVPGITQISRFDYERWGQFWSFTELSVRKLFETVAPRENITVKAYGNVKMATAFLYGLGLHEVKRKDWDYLDNDYQVVVTAVVAKPPLSEQDGLGKGNVLCVS